MKNNLFYEKSVWVQGSNFIAGIDEVGRGPLAGPVVACAVILPKEFYLEEIDDSKKLSSQKREELYNIIKKEAVSIGLGLIREDVIDRINIRQATFLAMKKAITRLKIPPDYLLVDGEKIPQIDIPQIPIFKGDSLSFTISSASIVAKVTRDRLMDKYHKFWPEYNFCSHKGYGTEEHLLCLEKYGVCPIHRRSFKPVTKALSVRGLYGS
ncbi:MAG: ribonuclease HII [bacterium]|nr:ribonuclease HII [bacterium]